MSTGDDPRSVRTLDRDTVWALLAKHPYGRLAVESGGFVDIFPVNHVVHQHKIYFRTAQGSKLSSVIVNDQVAFEVDEAVGEHTVRSVVVQGWARRLETSGEIAVAQQLPLRSWGATHRQNYVVIDVESATGREYTITDGPGQPPR